MKRKFMISLFAIMLLLPITFNASEKNTITLPGMDNAIGTNDDIIVNGENFIESKSGDVETKTGGTAGIPGMTEDVIVFPNGSTLKPNGTIITPSGNMVHIRPRGGIILPGTDKELYLKNEYTSVPNSADNIVAVPSNTGPISVNGDGSITMPEDQSTRVFAEYNEHGNYQVQLSNGIHITNDGVATTMDKKQARILAPEGEISMEIFGADNTIDTIDDVIIGNTSSVVNEPTIIMDFNGNNIGVKEVNNIYVNYKDAKSMLIQNTKNPLNVVVDNEAVINNNNNFVKLNQDYTLTLPGFDGMLNTEDDSSVIEVAGDLTFTDDFKIQSLNVKSKKAISAVVETIYECNLSLYDDINSYAMLDSTTYNAGEKQDPRSYCNVTITDVPENTPPANNVELPQENKNVGTGISVGVWSLMVILLVATIMFFLNKRKNN